MAQRRLEGRVPGFVNAQFQIAMWNYADEATGVRQKLASLFRTHTVYAIRSTSFTEAELSSSRRLVKAATRDFDKSVESIVDSVNSDISPGPEVAADEIKLLRAAAITMIERCADDAFRAKPPSPPAHVFGDFDFGEGDVPSER